MRKIYELNRSKVWPIEQPQRRKKMFLGIHEAIKQKSTMAEMVNYLKRVEGDLEGIGKDRDKKKMGRSATR